MVSSLHTAAGSDRSARPDAAGPRREAVRRPSQRRHPGYGCGTFLFVLVVGIVLSLFNLSVGAAVSVRVPMTTSNVTVGGSVGAKTKVTRALPDYARPRLGGNQNLFNYSQTMTVGPAEGAGLIVIGRQASAPGVDLHVAAR